jgi:hypothetical protein
MINETPDLNDPLDDLLRGAEEYISDNGFTARVVAALPAGRRHSWRRFALLCVAALACAILVSWQLPAAIATLTVMAKEWSAFQWPMLLAFVPLLTLLGTLGWVVSALVNDEE